MFNSIRKLIIYFISFFTKKENDCITFFIAAGKNKNYISENIKSFKNCDCILFKYVEYDIKENRCKQIYNKASWSKFLMLSNDYVKKTHKYITIVLDDVKIKNYSFEKTRYIIEKHEKSVVSPKIKGSYYDYNKINFTEIFVTTFSIYSWNCWLNMMMKLNINYEKTIGWGFDLCYPVFCPLVKHIKMNYTAYHVYKRRNSYFNKIGTNEVKKYNKISLRTNNKKCLMQT